MSGDISGGREQDIEKHDIENLLHRSIYTKQRLYRTDVPDSRRNSKKSE